MSYPASIQIDTPMRIARWRPIVQWILAIPHMLIIGIFTYLGFALGVISWFMILFTGRLPAGIADLQAMILRYGLRCNAYAGFLTDQYPPFAFDTVSDDPGGHSAAASFTPTVTGRNRVTVFFRIILMIPALAYAVIIGIIGAICSLLGFFAVLFTGRWPHGLRKLVVASLTVEIRLNAYTTFLTDEYPPFRTT